MNIRHQKLHLRSVTILLLALLMALKIGLEIFLMIYSVLEMRSHPRNLIFRLLMSP